MVPKDNWKIDLQKTAFVTIDLQNTWLAQGSTRALTKARDFIPQVNELANLCRKVGIPVIHVCMSVRADLSDIGLKQDIRPRTDSEWEYIEGRKGVEFYKDLEIKERDYEVKKIRYSAFIPGASSLEPLLRGLGRDSFIICGVATDICVEMTTADAFMLGFKVFYVGDLTATLSEERHRVALEVIDNYFAKVMTFKQVQEELKQLATTAGVTLG